MVTQTRKTLDANPAAKKPKENLALIRRALAFIGKPFYFVLFFLIIGILFVALLTGRATRLFLTWVLTSLLRSFNKLLKLFGQIIPSLAKFLSIHQLPYPRLSGSRLFGKKLPLKKLKSLSAGFLNLIKRISLPKLRLTKSIFALSAFFFFLSFWFFILKDLPSPSQLLTRKQEVSTKIYDRNGTLLYKIYKEKNRTPVPLNEIPLHVRLATLAAEDAEFYQHPGFSIKGIVRSVVRNIKRGELTGGSTITQQLVKNALLSPEKTITRKIREVILAVAVEITFTKDEILEMYLNEVSYGGTAYGIQEAAQLYFGKNVNEINLAEAALLAGLPKSPTKFSPFGPTPEAGLARQKEILKLMVANKYITKQQAEKAEKEALVFAPNKIDIKAPHFVMYVKQLLVEKYGEEVVEKGGLEVTTTLDYTIQRIAEESIRNELEKLAGLNVRNAAAIVVNPKTGEILAMVGSKDYFDTKNAGNVNVVTRPRQPGSSIKVVNYAYALSNGYTPATILSDTPVTFSVPGQPPYSPRNYDGKYRGKISLRSALAESRNVPAVKVLANYGVDKMIALGKKMGITTWNDPSRFGLSLTLGGGEVKLIDLAKVYATIANYGKRPEFTPILRITNYKGKVLEENFCRQETRKKEGVKGVKNILAAEASVRPCNGEEVLDPRVAYLLIDILKDNQARSPAFGSYSQLVIPKHPEVAVKTGTSNNLRDNLTVGFNQNYLVAVWVGNNDNSPMARVASGITGAAPIWNRIMRSLLAKENPQDWEVPEGLVKIPICTLTGTLPCKGCPVKLEWFLKETQPKRSCKTEEIVEEKGKPKKNPQGRILTPAASIER